MRTSAWVGVIWAWLLLAGGLAAPLPGDPYGQETPAQRDARMAWWREAKFGMFIHWGVYAVPAGHDDGRAISGLGEWIMLKGKIPVSRYQGYAKQFNPTRYNPDAWAALAKEAGMRYVVITSKHHDGFALYPSAATVWDVADATPWAKDLIGPLAKAVRAQGMKFGLYYSQAQDWTHPGGAKSGYQDGGGWDAAQYGSFDQYLDKVAVPQVDEILTRYQPDVLWWDTPHLMTPARAEKLVGLLAKRPGIIHNNRLGGGNRGDTETPEQEIPANGYPGRDWETCMTMNETWGFKKDDHQWKPVSTLITNLVDITSKGGNYLLNVGPDANGEIPKESIELLKGVGAWMKTHGDAIYGTHAGPFRKLAWGRCTAKPAGDDTLLYLHVFNWPSDGKLQIPGLTNVIRSAVSMENGQSLGVEPGENGPILRVSAKAPDPVCSTIALRIQGKAPQIDSSIGCDSSGAIRLTPNDAIFEGPELRVEQLGGQANIGYWNNPQEAVSWDLRTGQGGKFMIQVEAATPAKGVVMLVQGVGKLAYPVPQTAGFSAFQTAKIGQVILPKGGRLRLTLRPVADGWHPVNVRKVELIPMP